MLGVIIGIVSSLLIFTFYSKDEKAVKSNKQKKINQQKQRQQQKKKQQQQIQRIKNDPLIKKQKQQQQKKFQQQFMSKLDQKDKQVIQQYLQKNKKQGQTDQQAIKSASNQASLFVAFMFIVIITIVVAILILNGVELTQIQNGVLNFLQLFFPKIREARSATPVTSEEL